MFEQYNSLVKELKETDDMLQESKDDPEMISMLKEDLVRIRGDEDNYGEIDEMQDEIVDVILPKIESDKNSCTLEIMQAAGGSESSLFAEEILDMYKNYSRQMGF